MEVTSLGSAYLDDYRLSYSGAKSALNTKSPEDFREIFERAYSSEYAEIEEYGAFSDGRTASAKTVSNSANAPIDKTDKLYELCLELETYIVKNLINGMRNTVQKSGLVDDSFAGKMYEDMLYDEYAKDFTKNANFGLAEQAYRQLSRYNS
jgi:flagellar protein FlgJ